MKINIGTTSETKIKYVTDFFDKTGFKVTLSHFKVDTGVDKQPIGLGEITKGAENRAKSAIEFDKDAGLGVGLEGGLIEKSEAYSLICIASIYNGDLFFNGQSRPIKLPKIVSESVKNGEQLGNVIREFNSEEDDFDKSTHQELISRQNSFNEALKKAFNNFLDNRPYRIGAIAYIFDKENNILIDQLTDYAYEDWNFPGGGRDEKETAMDNIHRELIEELNIDKSDLKLIEHTKKPIKYDFPIEMIQAQHISAMKHRGQIKDQFIFKFIGDKSKITIDPKEIRTYKWAKVSQLKKYLTFPNQYVISIGTINKYLCQSDNIE